MRWLTLFLFVTACFAEILIPRGTRVRVLVPKAGAWTTQAGVTAGGTVVIAAGAPVTGLGESVQAIDGIAIPMKCDEGKTVRNCVTTEDHAVLVASRESVEATAQQRTSVVSSAGSDVGSTSLTVVANESGASIEMDKAYMGDAPLTFAVRPGRHRIIVRSGGKVWVRTLDVPSGAKMRVSADLQTP